MISSGSPGTSTRGVTYCSGVSSSGRTAPPAARRPCSCCRLFAHSSTRDPLETRHVVAHCGHLLEGVIGADDPAALRIAQRIGQLLARVRGSIGTKMPPLSDAATIVSTNSGWFRIIKPKRSPLPSPLAIRPGGNAIAVHPQVGVCAHFMGRTPPPSKVRRRSRAPAPHAPQRDPPISVRFVLA